MAGTKLIGTNLTGTDLGFVDLQFADLTGAIFDGKTVWLGIQWYYTICPDGTNSGESRDCF
tara:strand:- start:277 stop:459 length:183 start_codon:yes stop_codon:yes gene_type:complete